MLSDQLTKEQRYNQHIIGFFYIFFNLLNFEVLPIKQALMYLQTPAKQAKT
jgi:hypothetical protein